VLEQREKVLDEAMAKQQCELKLFQDKLGLIIHTENRIRLNPSIPLINI